MVEAGQHRFERIRPGVRLLRGSDILVAVDRGGFAVAYNGRSWVGLRYVDTGGQGLDTVSCPKTNFCVAVDADGNALIYNGRSWSQPVSIDSGGYYVSSV